MLEHYVDLKNMFSLLFINIYSYIIDYHITLSLKNVFQSVCVIFAKFFQRMRQEKISPYINCDCYMGGEIMGDNNFFILFYNTRKRL